MRQSCVARRGVDGDGVSVEQVVEDLPVGERRAAIHDVAARDARPPACAFSGRNFHLSGWPGCVRSSAYDDVGVRRDDVHRVADDERLSLVAAQHAGGEGPRRRAGSPRWPA